MPIYDSNNTIIVNGVETALSRPDVITIKNRLLDGSYHIQQIGNSGTLVDVECNGNMAEKIAFDNAKRYGSLIKVTFDSRYYIGVIDGDPSYERIPSQDYPMFKISFTLAVTEEGAL